ncbi:serine protease 1-like [Babylonia areolata]|uniref:serine protease 1-like n=1 Tax=Babylonia areolata TaxID=304850 RepID=UPI003FD49867
MRSRGEMHVLLLLLLHVLPGLHSSQNSGHVLCPFFRGTCHQLCPPGTYPISIFYMSFLCLDHGLCCYRASTSSPDITTTATTDTTTTPVPEPRCGVTGGGRLTTGRIVGGGPAARCEFPWMVYLDLSPGPGSSPCGGALLDRRHVLTAAHCFRGRTPEITIGEYNRNEAFLPQDKFTTTNFIVTVHPEYNPLWAFNDIAIIRLRTPIDYSKYRCIQPICLPAEGTGRFPPGTACIVAGWGVTEPDYDVLNPPTPAVLKKVTVPIVSQSVCQATYTRAFNSTTEICAGRLDGSGDSCHGDSGGPLMCRSGSGSGEYHVAGIVSSGHSCAQPQTPAIYTDVTYFLPWIHNVIGSG